jgi:hypothetical protein
MLLLPSAGNAQPSSGIAYDVVSIYGMTATGPGGMALPSPPGMSGVPTIKPYDPTTFDADVAAMQSKTGAVPSGSATRVYLTPTKARVDNLVTGLASIVDCAANTVTVLDTAKKTYTVQSFDPAATASQSSPLGPLFGNATLSGTADSKAAGTRRFGQLSLDEYDMTANLRMNFSGMTMGDHFTVTSYIDSTKKLPPGLQCFSAHLPTAIAGVIGLSGAQSDPLAAIFSKSQNAAITRTGVTAPAGALSVYTVLQGQLQGDPPLNVTASITSMTEVGHVRPISSDDPVFTIPRDYHPASTSS